MRARHYRVLAKKGVPFEEIDVFKSQESRAQMEANSGVARIVYQIFVGDTHVGGSDDLYALEKDAKLDSLLSKNSLGIRSLTCDRQH